MCEKNSYDKKDDFLSLFRLFRQISRNWKVRRKNAFHSRVSDCSLSENFHFLISNPPHTSLGNLSLIAWKMGENWVKLLRVNPRGRLWTKRFGIEQTFIQFFYIFSIFPLFYCLFPKLYDVRFFIVGTSTLPQVLWIFHQFSSSRNRRIFISRTEVGVSSHSGTKTPRVLFSSTRSSAAHFMYW